MAEKKEAVEKVKAAEEVTDYYEEYVDFYAARYEKHTDPIVVTLNGVNIVVPRGEHVKIKRKYALILEESERQESKAFEVIEGKRTK